MSKSAFYGRSNEPTNCYPASCGSTIWRKLEIWFESRRSGTGIYFIRCVDAAISLISRYPEVGPVQFGEFRRILVSRFPLAVFYTIEADVVVVHGVFHSSRDPDKIREALDSGAD